MLKDFLRVGMICVLLAAMVAGVFVAGYIRPGIPAEWKTIAVGQSRGEVLERISDVQDMHGLKGFDLVTCDFTQWGFRACWWQLQITYDQDDAVRTVEARFTDPNCGWFNTCWVLAGR